MCKKILLLISLTLLGNTLYASHTMGADISYRYIGPNQYEVTLSFYRDCSGASTPGGCDYSFSSDCASVSGSSCSSSGPIYFYMRSTSCGYCIKDQFTGAPVITEVTPICASSTTTCKGGSNPGVEQWKYTKIVTLPAPCTDWQFVYGSYARNPAINTLTSTSVGMFVSATLNSVAAPTNSSPTFANLPVPWLCVNQPFCYNQGVTEANGDSLFYSLITPLQDVSGATVNYSSPYSATNPLASSPKLTLNTSNGDICFTPTQIQVTVMAIKVSEYRKGILVGSTVRDIQITVISCNNKPPVLSGIDGTTNYTKTVCAGSSLCFDITSSDPDAANILTMSWNSGIPGATFTITNNKTATPTGRFCWTPTGADIRPQPYVFSALVKDDACLYYASQAKAYNINVISCGPTVTATSGSVCPGVCTNVIATGSGGTTPYSYSWNPGSGSGTSFSVCPISTTTYTVVITDKTGGTASNTAKVTVNTAPNVNIAGTTTICNGSSSILTASGGGTYIWSTGSTSTAITVSPVTTSTYSVSATTNGCTGSKTVSVTVSLIPIITINPTSICAGGSATLTAMGGTDYLWNTGASTSTITVSPLTTTSYSVIVTTTGCSATASATITVGSSITPLITGTTSICNGGSTTLSTNGGGIYAWSDGTSNPSITVSPTIPTSYSVTVTNGSCSGKASVEVTITPNPSPIISGNTSVCPGTSTTLTATGGTSYIWSTTETSPSISVSPTIQTTYTVTGTTNTCTGQTTVVVSLTPPPSPTITGTTAICIGGSSTLTATGGGSYLWSTTATTPSITVSPGTTTSYSVVVTTGCSASASIQVTVQSTLVPIITGSTTICNGTGTTLTTSGGGTYLWSDNTTNPSITVSPSTNSSYSVTVTSGLCSGTASVQVTVSPNPNPGITGNMTICNGSITTLTATAGDTYSWSSGQSTASITVNPTSNTNYTVIVTTNGCTGSATATITVNPTPSPTITGINTICTAGSTTLTEGSTGGPYTWTPGGETTASITVSPGITTNYVVSVTQNGCTGTIGQTVTVVPPITASITGKNICVGESVTLTGVTNGISYQWSPGGQTSPTITETPSGTTTYTLVTSIGNCANTATYAVTVNPLPLALASGDTLINYGSSTPLKSNGGGTYEWIPPASLNCSNCQNPIATPSQTTQYCVIVTQLGCSDSACVTVRVDLKCGFEGELFVPNGFSPNDDGQNDVLYVRGAGITGMYWTIYDRWGEKVFETSNPKQGWDGTYKGKHLDPAVFVYYLEVTCITGDQVKQKGNVAIVK